MSIFNHQTLACPKCGESFGFDVGESVNADRRPDLRDSILSGRYQATLCPQCEAPVRCEPQLNYLDVGRGQWILAKPAADVANWVDLEVQTQAIFELAYGNGASAPAREIGAGLQVRAVFGWPALNEKILAAGAGLDDVALECAKLQLMRALDGPPLGDTVELRLVAVNGHDLLLAWLDAADEQPLETLNVPRALVDEIAADAARYGALREALSAGPFVDMARMLIDPADVEQLPAFEA